MDQYPPVPPKLTDVAVIMYTSGSTGKVCIYTYILYVCVYMDNVLFSHLSLSLYMIAKGSHHDT